MTRWLALSFVLLLATPAWGQTAGDWTLATESVPADGDNISAGAQRIRETRARTRQRSETETCFGTAVSTGCDTADDGRHRLGSAKAFFVDTEPAAIHAADNAAGESTALDDARLWVASDQGEDNGDAGQSQGGRLYVYDATTADGHDGGAGAGWEPVVALTKVDYEEILYTATDSDWFDDGAWEDWDGGATSPADTICNATAPDEGNWRVFVEYSVNISTGTAGDSLAVRLCDRTTATCVGGAGGTVLQYTSCGDCGARTDRNPGPLANRYVADITKATTVDYSLEFRLQGGGTDRGDINVASAVTDDDADSWLRCWVEPRI